MRSAIKTSQGLSLIELIIGIVIIGILAVGILLLINPGQIRENSRKAATDESLSNIAKAAKIHSWDTGNYATETAKGVDPTFASYMAPPTFPSGPFPGSSFDWDNWYSLTCWDGSTGIIQITLRDINDYKGFTNYTLYYVIHGLGIPDCTDSDIKGECINCPSRYP